MCCGWPQDSSFDLVVMGEAAQALEIACWSALLKGQRALLAGDHLQLPPTVQSEEAQKRGLGVTLFERLTRLHGKEILTLLTVQVCHWSTLGSCFIRWFLLEDAADVPARSSSSTRDLLHPSCRTGNKGLPGAPWPTERRWGFTIFFKGLVTQPQGLQLTSQFNPSPPRSPHPPLTYYFSTFAAVPNEREHNAVVLRRALEGKVTAFSAVASHRLCDLDHVKEGALTEQPLVLVDTAGCDMGEFREEEGESLRNEGEAEVVVQYVQKLLEAGVKGGRLGSSRPTAPR